jgi:hypothetical protein
MSDEAAFGAFPFDSAWAACQDWFDLGLRLGLRRGEWAQEDGTLLSSPDKDVYGDPKAFCLGDFRFECTSAKNRKRLRGAQVLLFALGDLKKCWVKFRTQKNGENGEEKLLTGKALQAIYRIIQRFVSLRSISDAATPLAIFKDPISGEAKFITTSTIEKTMRTVAMHTYGLHPIREKADLQRWSAHSLRVGACVILHTMGFSGYQIKFLLRWKSDTFMMYLRNVAILSNKQDEAMDELAALPDLI